MLLLISSLFRKSLLRGMKVYAAISTTALLRAARGEQHMAASLTLPTYIHYFSSRKIFITFFWPWIPAIEII